MEGQEFFDTKLLNAVLSYGEAVLAKTDDKTLEQAIYMVKVSRGMHATTAQGTFEGLEDYTKQAYLDAAALKSGKMTIQEWATKYGGGNQDVKVMEGLANTLYEGFIQGDPDKLGVSIGLLVNLVAGTKIIKGQLTKSTTQFKSLWVDKLGNIKWPSNFGFKSTPTRATLGKGTKFSRYGEGTGSFASPEGTPYTKRALPPGSETKPLNTYEVLKPFEVSEGEVAPWFGEEGGGTQYKFDTSVDNLIKEGYIRKVEP